MKFLLMFYENMGVTILVREADGMMLASVMANRIAVYIDSDPGNVRTHLFLDNDHALRYLKEIVAVSIAGGVSCEFEKRDGDSRVVMPPGGMLGRPH